MPYQRVTLVGAGQMSEQEREIFHAYMQARNNTFTNSQGQSVVITRATVTDHLHDSTAISDPYDTAHWDITLTNDVLFENDGSTHLLHFRPANPNTSFFYTTSLTRNQVTAIQNSKRKSKSKKKSKGDKHDKHDKHDQGGRGGGGAGGGGGAVKTSSRDTTTGSRYSSSQTHSSTGRSHTHSSTGRSHTHSSTGRSHTHSSGGGRR